MSYDSIIPTSYEHWRHCIEVIGNIQLTPKYIDQRLKELCDEKHVKTKEFAKLYGADQLQRTITWFRQAADEMRGNSTDS